MNSNDISSINIINNNNKNEKIDLGKYMYMYFTFFVNRVTLNLFMDDKRDLSQLILDEFFLIFKQKMDFSSVCLCQKPRSFRLHRKQRQRSNSLRFFPVNKPIRRKRE